MNVVVMVNGMEIKYNVKKDLYFDTENTFDELGKQAGTQTWWWSLVAMKENELVDFKTEMEGLLAEIELGYRANPSALEAQYGKVTEGVIKACIAKDDKVQALHLQLHGLQRDVAMLKAMGKGMDSRGVMLATAGSAAKAEAQARLREMVKNASPETPEA